MSVLPPQHKSLRDFRESSSTLFAKNHTRNKVTCHTDKVDFELEPAGSDDSVRVMPKECLDVPGFQRLWMRRSVTISDDPDMENEIVLLMGGRVAVGPVPVMTVLNDGTEQSAWAVLTENPHTNDIVLTADTDPNSRTFGQVKTGPTCLICGETAYIAQRFLDSGEPPLCSAHAADKTRVVSSPQPDGTWTHQVMSATPPPTP